MPTGVHFRRARQRSRKSTTVALAAALVAFGSSAAATEYRGSPDDYLQAIKRLRAGDTLVLAPGDYRNGLPAYRLAGAPDRPITISGPEGVPTATFIARPGRNTISLVDSHHLVIRNLRLEGNSVPVDAVKAERPSRSVHHVTLENLVIRGHGNNQQTVGISTKCPAWNWVIRDVTIVGAGTGMYLGNSDGSAPFVAGLIERNLIIDTIGYNLQIKHQLARPDIPGMPTGPSMTVIRHNVFAKPDAGSPDSARPNVLVGHFPIEGSGADDDYAVYGNFFYQNRYEALFQGEGNVALYANVFVNSHGDGVRIQPHNDIPRRVVVAFNTIVAKGAGIVIAQREGAPDYPQQVSGNAVFAGTPITAAVALRNVAAPMDEASAYLVRPFAPLGELDLRPKGNWPAAVSGEKITNAPFPAWDRDFDGKPRTPGTLGAYRDTGAGWLPRLERKP